MVSVFGFGLVNNTFNGKSVRKTAKSESYSAKGKEIYSGKIEQIPRKL